MTQKIRLVSGLILFAFLTSHLINLSFGLISLQALDAARPIMLVFWATIPGVMLVVLSVMAHLVLGLQALYARNTLSMSRTDLVQLVLGLIIFPLLFGHMLAVILSPLVTGTRQSYFSLLTLFWVLDPVLGLKQVIVTVIVWIHGCMGLVIWMRIQSWWARVAGFVYPLVILIPLLALLGMVEAGKEVIALNKDPAMTAEALKILPSAPELYNKLVMIQSIGIWGYFTILALVLLARYIRVRKDQASLYISYADGRRLDVKAGLTLLEISRMNHVPHASLCGGHGRCGSCQVRIVEGAENLPPVTRDEAKTLARFRATPDVRLACQIIPVKGVLSIERLLPAYLEPHDLREALKAAQGGCADAEPDTESATAGGKI